MENLDKDVLNEIDLSKVVLEHTKSLESPAKFRAILCDLYPKHKKEVNLLVNAHEQEIWKEMKGKSELSSLEVGRFVSMLEDAYGIKQSYCVWAVETWAKAYNVKCDINGFLKQKEEQANVIPQNSAGTTTPPGSIQQATMAQQSNTAMQNNAVSQSNMAPQNNAMPQNNNMKKRWDKKKKIGIFSGGIAAVVAIALLVNCLILPMNNYNQAIECMAAENYEDAIKYFAESKGYKDSENKLVEAKATQKILAEEYEEALALLQSVDEYDEVLYLQAKVYGNQQMYQQAAELYQSLGNYKDAKEKLEEYQGLLLAEYEKGLSYQESGRYEMAIEIFEQLGSYSDAAKQLEETRKMQKYDNAMHLFITKEYANAAEVFKELGDYEDSLTYYEQAVTGAKYQEAVGLVSEKKLAEAVEIFKELGTYQDAEEQVQRIEENYESALDLLESGQYKEAVQKFEELGNYKESMSKLVEASNNYNYNWAVGKLEQGQYAEAEKVFKELGDYLDSAQLMKEAGDAADYEEAATLMKKGDVAGAVKLLEGIEGYKDAGEQVEEIEENYKKAKEYIAQENIKAATALLEELGNYENSASLLAELTNADNYAKAVKYVEDGDYSKAADLFKKLGTYEDSKQQYEDVKDYMDALAYLENNKYAEAVKLLSGLGNYLDAKERVAEIEEDYSKAKEYQAAGEYEKAVELLEGLGNYEDSEKLILELASADMYKDALNYAETGKYDKAIELFQKLGNYEDSKQKLNNLTDYCDALDYLKNGKQAEAVKLLSSLGEFLDAEEKVSEIEGDYDEAVRQMNAGNYDKAVSLFESLGNYKDAREQLKEATNAKNYADALSYLNKKEYDKAISAFKALGNYKDSAKQLETIEFAKNYDTAIAALNKGDYRTAVESLKKLEDYPEAEEKLEELYSSPKYLAYLRETKPVNILAGTDYLYGITENGEVINQYGNKVEGWKNIVQITAGGSYLFGIKKNGTVLMRHGDNETEEIFGCDNAVAIDAGDYQVVVLSENGEVYQMSGDTGLIYPEYKGSLKKVESWNDVIAVSAGDVEGYYAALKSDGTVLLSRSFSDDVTATVSKWTKIAQIEVYAGTYYGGAGIVAIKEDGSVVCTGNGGITSTLEWMGYKDWNNVVDIYADYTTSGGQNIYVLQSDGKVIRRYTDYYGYNEKFGYVSEWADKNIIAVEDGGGITSTGEVLGIGSSEPVFKNIYVGVSVTSGVDNNSAKQVEVDGITKKYNAAVEALNKRDYKTAVESLKKLEDYPEAEEKLEELYSSPKYLAYLRETKPVNVFAEAAYFFGITESGEVVNEYGKTMEGWSNVVQLAASNYYLFGIKRNGTVLMMINDYDGETEEIYGCNDAVAIDAGTYQVVVLSESGEVYHMSGYERGYSSTNYKGRSLKKVEGWTDVVAVSADNTDGYYAGLKSDGTVLLSSKFSDDVVAEISRWTEIAQIEVGYGVIIGVKENGDMVNMFYSSTPWNADTFPENIVDVSKYGLALCSDGKVVNLVGAFYVTKLEGKDIVAVEGQYCITSDGEVFHYNNSEPILTGIRTSAE